MKRKIASLLVAASLIVGVSTCSSKKSVEIPSIIDSVSVDPFPNDTAVADSVNTGIDGGNDTDDNR